MKKLISILCSTLFILSVNGQSAATTTNAPVRFNSINQAGLSVAEKGQSFMLQTINGLSKNNWFGGLGTGVDFYGTRSVPLFIDVRKKIGADKNSPFVYFDGGINFSWATSNQKLQKGYAASGKVGGYYEGGIGWSIQTKGKEVVLLSAGYSYKQIKEKAEVFNFGSWPTPDKTYEYYNYQYRRIVIKVGIQL